MHILYPTQPPRWRCTLQSCAANPFPSHAAAPLQVHAAHLYPPHTAALPGATLQHYVYFLRKLLIHSAAPLQVHVAYDDVWERRDVLGVHPQKQPGLFWVGACVPAGRLQAQDFFEFARIADK